MNLLPSFSIWQFAAAGAICAMGPVIIHLLNRRRYRVVQWAAMDFLREALQRNRRIMQMRDLLLLLLRTAAVLLVGLALAQPFFSQSEEVFDGTKPLHAVLVIDNSLSMGFQPGTVGAVESNLLTEAKRRAKQYIEALPEDSRVSVIALCGSRSGYSPDAYTKEDAQRALDRIELVDRAASVQRALNEARKACDAGPKLAKRVVFIGDQQAANWRDATAPEEYANLASVQVVEVSGGEVENTWISDFRVQDGIADAETPTTFIAELQHVGSLPRENVQVTLKIEGVEVASQTVTLDPGLGAREVTFQQTLNSFRPEPGKPVAVAAEVSLTPDRLPDDDRRFLVVHVVAALPVVFADQYRAEEEDPVRRRLGETRHLRRLLAPVTSRSAATQQLVQVRHVKFAELDQQTLEDARLLVVAGIADPAEHVSLLREYVWQGGQLVIAAGGRYDPALNSGFDPMQWTAAAWRDGAGILPAPLAADMVGVAADEATDQLRPFFLSFESLKGHDYFQLAGVGENELRDLYAEPLFFKAVQTDVSNETLDALQAAETERLTETYRTLAELRQQADQASVAADAGMTEAEERRRREADERVRGLQPDWLLWAHPSKETLDATDDVAALAAKLANRSKPRVLARFDNDSHTPFLVQREIGDGTVLFVSTGLLENWNTLPQTNTFLIFDRILRSMVQSTLPQRNFPAQPRITLPLSASDRDVSLTLDRPAAEAVEVVDTGFIGTDRLGFSIDHALTRGLYRVVAYRDDQSNMDPSRETAWEMPLAINGPAEESELQPMSRQEFEERIAAANVSWVGDGETISLAGRQIRGQDSWWWLVLAVLAVLCLECGMLAWGSRRRQLVQAG